MTGTYTQQEEGKLARSSKCHSDHAMRAMYVCVLLDDSERSFRLEICIYWQRKSEVQVNTTHSASAILFLFMDENSRFVVCCPIHNCAVLFYKCTPFSSL